METSDVQDGDQQIEAKAIRLSISSLDKKFRKACDQILLLNNQIDELQVRYDRALKDNRRSFRYSLRLRLATLEGVRNMYYEYASRSADQLETLQARLIDLGSSVTFEEYPEQGHASSDSDDNIMSDNELLDMDVNVSSMFAASRDLPAAAATATTAASELYTSSDDDTSNSATSQSGTSAGAVSQHDAASTSVASQNYDFTNAANQHGDASNGTVECEMITSTDSNLPTAEGVSFSSNDNILQKHYSNASAHESTSALPQPGTSTSRDHTSAAGVRRVHLRFDDDGAVVVAETVVRPMSSSET